jgi:hypothetical protein
MTNNEIAGDEGALEGDQERRIQFPLILTLIAFVLGLTFEILFYGHAIGISFSIMALLCVGGLLIAAWREKVTFARENLLLAIPILFFSIMSFLRLEPLTVFLNVVLALMLFALWLRTFISGCLLDYGWLDFGLALSFVPIEAWIRPWGVLGEAQKRIFKEGQGRGVLLAIFRGLLLAIPILAVFLGLLMAADLIFQERVESALEWLDIERVLEYAGRIIVVVLSTLFFLGAMVAAFRDPSKRKLIGQDKPILKPFLGFIEAVVILGAVDLLFASFLAIQFTYLFGGEANITLTGYTYAEYARRGFSELVMVGVLSLGLILTLAWWTKRESARVRGWFNLLSTLLVLQVGVILASALTRLLLYEEAYGFTRLRTYTHLFIPWMGVALVVFLVLLFLAKLRYFAPAVAVCAIGFTVTLNLVNIDVFILGRNVNRYEESDDLDVRYLASLSEDTAPEIVDLVQDLSGEEKEDLMRELACWHVQLETQMEEQTWPSTHLSRLAAKDAFEPFQETFESYEITQEEWGNWVVRVDGDERLCAHQSGFR